MAEVTPYDPTPDLQTYVLGPEDSVRNTPFGFGIAYTELQTALNNGSITKGDIVTLRQSGRFMQAGSVMGALAGLPLYSVLRRRNPFVPAILPLTATALMMYAGSVGGYTLGAMVAVPWMRKRMDNGSSKVEVFRQLIRNEMADEITEAAHRGEEYADRLRGTSLKAEDRKEGNPA